MCCIYNKTRIRISPKLMPQRNAIGNVNFAIMKMEPIVSCFNIHRVL